MQNAVRTPWEVLGVAEGAPIQEVRKAFFRRARETHPDRPGGDAEAFRQAKAAFDTLMASPPMGTPKVRVAPSGRNPYAAWTSSAVRPRVWQDDDPLLAGIGASVIGDVDFGTLIATEMGRLDLQAA